MPLFEYMDFDNGMPPEPKNGIPKYFLPFLVRWAVRLTFLPFIFLDQAAQYLASRIIRSPFEQTGQCKRRGFCCYYILIPMRKGDLLGKLQRFWVKEFNGFFSRDRVVKDQDNRDWEVMGCRYLKKNSSCGVHFFRPAICRSWPKIEAFHEPRLLKGCGYQIKIRDPRYQEALKMSKNLPDSLKMYSKTSQNQKSEPSD